MAQHDYAIANQGFPAFRSDLNDALAAIVSNNSGATEPTTMFAHQMWVDTAADPSILKIRNADNDAWITIGTINQTGDTFTLTSAVSATTLNTSGPVVFNDAGADVDFRVEGDTDANLLFVDASADAVGIGATTVRGDLNIYRTAANFSSSQSSDYGSLFVQGGNANTSGSYHGAISFGKGISGVSRESYKYGAISLVQTTADVDQNGLAFFVSPNADQVTPGTLSEAMRIDSSGNVGIGTNTPGAKIEATASGAAVQILNRTTSDGNILEFEKDGTTVGTIGVTNFRLFVGTGDTGLRFAGDADTIVPWNPATNLDRDDAIDLGASNGRFDDIYATNGTIQTSDRNEKQDIEELSEAETRVAVAAKGLLRKYRWKSAVAEKGDDARIHFGIIAQDLKAAFEAEGLDAGRYAMFIHSAWWEKERVIPAVEGKEAVYETQTDEEGNETQVLVSEAVEAQPERTVIDTFETEEEGAVRKERMGIRYNELLAFIIAAI